MKRILLISVNFSLAVSNVFSQDGCSNIKIESPVVAKPREVIASTGCTSFVLQWNEPASGSNDAYIASIMFRDASDPAHIDTASSPIVSGTLIATFPVTPGMVVSWNIQGMKTIDGRTFYSYPLRSSDEYTIPDCASSASTADYTPTLNKDLPLREEERIKVELYPNPVHTILNLNISSMLKHITATNGFIKVVAVDGKTVLTQKVAFGSVRVNVSNLINGNYFMRIEDAGGKLLYIAKFIKE